MKALEDDMRQVRIGNADPETVPVHIAGENPAVRYVQFSDLSANVRRILDICQDVDIHVDGRRQPGVRAFRDVDGRRGPVLQWNAPEGRR